MVKNIAVAYNDVDLCLKLRRAGLKAICDPGIRPVHKESVGRGGDVDPIRVVRLRREAERMAARRGRQGLRDPFYNLAFSTRSGDFELAEYWRVTLRWKDPAACTTAPSETVSVVDIARRDGES